MNHNSLSKKVLPKEESYEATYKYSCVTRDKYKLLLSKEEALEMGISSAIYMEMQSYLRKANNVVTETLKTDPSRPFLALHRIFYYPLIECHD